MLCMSQESFPPALLATISTNDSLFPLLTLIMNTESYYSCEPSLTIITSLTLILKNCCPLTVINHHYTVEHIHDFLLVFDCPRDPQLFRLAGVRAGRAASAIQRRGEGLANQPGACPMAAHCVGQESC